MQNDSREPPEEAPDASFADILKEFEAAERRAPSGGPRRGTVVGISGDYVLIDYGSKAEGVIPSADLLDRDGKLTVKRGDTFDVAVTGRNNEGMVTLSRVAGRRPQDWDTLTRAFQNKEIIAGRITATVKGGFTVDVGTRAFLPASRSGARTPAEMEQLVGQEIRCRIIKLDINDEDVVVDRRSVLEEEARQMRQSTWEEAASRLNAGDRVTGVVTRLADFGAFVELQPGVEGLIHVSEMSWTKRIKHPSEVLKEGERVEAVVKDRYPSGKIVEGKITRLAKFGAFVEVEEGIEGLVHISDFTNERRIQHPNEIVKPGQVVRAIVLSADPDTKRLKLGMKQLEATPADQFIEQLSVGDHVTGRVIQVRGDQVTVQLAEGVEGVCRVQETAAGGPASVSGGSLAERLAAAWKGGVKAAENYQEGQIRSFTIKAIDAAGKRIELVPA
ncbi:MAG: hypothetical protein DMG17_24225 [Acidobacteria bacterium]|nr:MAG: hypothetical protein DMG17_24225 [Acidobacteriota bacterium]